MKTSAKNRPLLNIHFLFVTKNIFVQTIKTCVKYSIVLYRMNVTCFQKRNSETFQEWKKNVCIEKNKIKINVLYHNIYLCFTLHDATYFSLAFIASFTWLSNTVVENGGHRRKERFDNKLGRIQEGPFGAGRQTDFFWADGSSREASLGYCMRSSTLQLYDPSGWNIYMGGCMTGNLLL